jgi:hypothetical protein
MNTKKCIGPCKTEKALDQFSVDQSQMDGHFSWCKACRGQIVHGPHGAQPPRMAKPITMHAAPRAPSRVKVCGKCRLPQPVDSFSPDRNRSGWCRSCREGTAREAAAALAAQRTEGGSGGAAAR